MDVQHHFFTVLLCGGMIILLLSGCTSSKKDPPPNTLLDQPISLPPGSGSCATDSDCVKGGCSGTICQSAGEEPVITTCEWQEKYQCYQAVSCVCMNTKCQWSDGSALTSCLQGYED